MSLTQVTIPGSVTKIGEDFLGDCPSLKQIIVPSDGRIQNILRKSDCEHNQKLAESNIFVSNNI
jgi:hypothetical protein